MKYCWNDNYYEVVVLDDVDYSHVVAVHIFRTDKEFDEFMSKNFELPMEVRRIGVLVYAQE